MRLIDADALIKVIQQNDYMLTAKHNSMAPGMFTSGIRQAVDEAPTIDPAKWIPVSERLPEVETEVVILAITKTGHKVITTAMYENGKMPNGDSIWNWYDVDFNYDEENDEYLIPEGWWEYRHYNPDDVYNNAVDNVVTHWMPLPDLPKMDGEV